MTMILPIYIVRSLSFEPEYPDQEPAAYVDLTDSPSAHGEWVVDTMYVEDLGIEGWVELKVLTDGEACFDARAVVRGLLQAWVHFGEEWAPIKHHFDRPSATAGPPDSTGDGN